MPTVSPVVYVEDKRLVARLLAGDEARVHAVLRRPLPSALPLRAGRTGRDTGAAEDAAQAALSKALESLASYRGEAQLFTWLCAICRSEISLWLPQDGPARSARRAARRSSGRARGRRLVGCGRRRSRGRAACASNALATSKSRSIGCRRATATRSSGNTSKGSPRKRSRRGLNIGLEATNSLLARAKRAFKETYASMLDASVERRSSERDAMNDATAATQRRARPTISPHCSGASAARERPRRAGEAAAYRGAAREWRDVTAARRRRRLTRCGGRRSRFARRGRRRLRLAADAQRCHPRPSRRSSASKAPTSPGATIVRKRSRSDAAARLHGRPAPCDRPRVSRVALRGTTAARCGSTSARASSSCRPAPCGSWPATSTSTRPSARNDAAGSAPVLAVQTPAGEVVHIGTQFMVDASTATRSCSACAKGKSRSPATASRSSSTPTSSSICVPTARASVSADRRATGNAGSGPRTIAPQIELDGRTTFDVMAWAARETGRRVVYRTPAAETHARDAVLRGIERATAGTHPDLLSVPHGPWLRDSRRRHRRVGAVNRSLLAAVLLASRRAAHSARAPPSALPERARRPPDQRPSSTSCAPPACRSPTARRVLAPSLTVRAPPAASDPVELVREILAPHGLTLRLVEGLYIVVRAAPETAAAAVTSTVTVTVRDSATGALVAAPTTGEVSSGLAVEALARWAAACCLAVRERRYGVTLTAQGFAPARISVPIAAEPARARRRAGAVAGRGAGDRRDGEPLRTLARARDGTVLHRPTRDRAAARLRRRSAARVASVARGGGGHLGASAYARRRAQRDRSRAEWPTAARSVPHPRLPKHVQRYRCARDRRHGGVYGRLSRALRRQHRRARVGRRARSAGAAPQRARLERAEHLGALGRHDRRRHRQLARLGAGAAISRTWSTNGSASRRTTTSSASSASASPQRTHVSVNALTARDRVLLVTEADPTELEQSANDTRNNTSGCTGNSSGRTSSRARRRSRAAPFTARARATTNDPEKIVATSEIGATSAIAGVRQDWTAHVGDAHTLSWGAEYQQQRADYDYSAAADYFGFFLTFPDVPPTLRRNCDARHRTASCSASTSPIAGRSRAATTAELGLRWDKHGYTDTPNERQLSPRLSVRHELTRGTASAVVARPLLPVAGTPRAASRGRGQRRSIRRSAPIKP